MNSVKDQDEDHEQRFDRFLGFCEVQRVNRSRLPSDAGEDMSAVSEPMPVLRSRLLSQDADTIRSVVPIAVAGRIPNMDSESDDNSDDSTFTNSDQDTYYGDEYRCKEVGSFEREAYGSTSYYQSTYADFISYSTKYPETPTSNVGEVGLPLNANDTFRNYESHVSTTRSPLEDNDDVTDRERMRTQSSEMFSDLLVLDFQTSSRLPFERSRLYKNNIAACSQKHNILFVAVGSVVQLVETARIGSHKISTALQVETRPPITTDEQMRNATQPQFPHTINYMKMGRFLGEEVVGMVCDDGRAILYKTRSLVDVIMRHKPMMLCSVDPDYTFAVGSSAWGLDFRDNMVVVSDNNFTVTLFVHNDGVTSSVATTRLLHNIASVALVDDECGVCAAAGCISGELVLFHFPITADGVLSTPEIISRLSTHESVWTTACVDAKYFKKETSLYFLTGSLFVDDDVMVNRTLLESSLLGVESDECCSSHLGLAAEFQNLFIPTFSMSQDRLCRNFNPFTNNSDRFRRIKKAYDDYYVDVQRARAPAHVSKSMKQFWQPVAASARFKDKFLLVTSELKAGLFRASRLVCNATASNVFDCKPTFQLLPSSNRLSLSLLIPELSCYIVASQVGLVSVFRLTQYRGLYSMRQEYVIPRPLGDPSSPERMMIGLTAKRGGDDTFFVYLVYSDGLLQTYRVSEGDSTC